jgi:large subunit ribosomal protein L3
MVVATAASLARAGLTASSRCLLSIATRYSRTNDSILSSSSCCALFSTSATNNNFFIGSGSRRPFQVLSAAAAAATTTTTNNNNNNTVLPSSCRTFATNSSTYTSTPPLFKIYSMNSDLPTSEIQKIIDAELAKIAEDKLAKEYRDWKPGMRKRPLVMSYRLEDFEEEASGVPSRWNPGLNKRCGALGIKLGMMPIWDKWGERHPCTVLYLDSNIVLRNKTSDSNSKDGYDAVQIGAGERKAKNVTKPLMGHYAKWGVAEHPPYIVREFRVTSKEAMPPPGTRIHARHFVPGQNVDIAGISKGKGFQGGMKRHGFKGMPASHGTSLSHRAIGSTVSSCIVVLQLLLW